jgi:hypothetical protein
MTTFKRNNEPLTPEQLSDHSWTSALTDILHARHTLHVPPQEDDADMVIDNAVGQRDATIRLLARELEMFDRAVDWWTEQAQQIATSVGARLTVTGDKNVHPLAQQWIEWARQQEDDTDATT